LVVVPGEVGVVAVVVVGVLCVWVVAVVVVWVLVRVVVVFGFGALCGVETGHSLLACRLRVSKPSVRLARAAELATFEISLAS
jgi:hypothetical protein